MSDDREIILCPNCNDAGCEFCEEVEERHPEEPVSFTDVFGDDDPEDDWQNDEFDEGEYDDLYEDDGQPSEYDEWQDYMGGDDWDHGQYDDYGEDW